jgi:cobalt-zinc-cadmium efflux system outer membrane protein
VSQAYIAALEAREEVRVLTASAASLRQEADIAATRVQAGDLASSDRAQIEIAAAQLDLAAGSARATARTAVLVIESLLNRSAPMGDTLLTDSLERLPWSLVEGETPAAPRPDVAAAEAGLAKAESDLRLQRRALWPDVTLTLQYERQPPDQPNTVGLGVSLPLPLWNRNASGIGAARAARAQAEAQLEKVRTQASADVAAARVAYAEARARAETYLRELQPKSTAIVQTVTYAYGRGGAALVELLAAERNDHDIRLATARAQADAAATAIALAAALNRLDLISHALPGQS